MIFSQNVAPKCGKKVSKNQIFSPTEMAVHEKKIELNKFPKSSQFHPSWHVPTPLRRCFGDIPKKVFKTVFKKCLPEAPNYPRTLVEHFFNIFFEHFRPCSGNLRTGTPKVDFFMKTVTFITHKIRGFGKIWLLPWNLPWKTMQNAIVRIRFALRTTHFKHFFIFFSDFRPDGQRFWSIWPQKCYLQPLGAP